MKRKYLAKKHMAVLLSAALAAGSLSMAPTGFAGMATVYAQEGTEEGTQGPAFQFEAAGEEGASDFKWTAGENGSGSLALDIGAAPTLKIKGELGEAQVEWKSSESDKDEKEQIIKLEDAEGGKKVTALKPGTATITATIPAKAEEAQQAEEGQEAEPQAVLTCEVTVHDYYLAAGEGTELNEAGGLTLNIGGEGILAIQGKTEGKTVEWKAEGGTEENPVIQLKNEEEQAEGQETATVKAVAPGTATVTATITETEQQQEEGSGAQPEPTVLTCEVEVKDYHLSAEELDLKIGGTQTLTVNGELPEGAKVTWASKDEEVASVSESGEVTAQKAGETTVTASISQAEQAEAGETEAEPMKVLECKVTVGNYSLAPAAMELDLDEPTATLTLTAKEEVDFEGVTITAAGSDPEVASVEEAKEAEAAEDGEEETLPSKKFTVTAKKAGETAITVSITGEGEGAATETHTCTVTVKEKAAASVTISPKTATVKVGKTVTLSAAVAPENASNKDVTWATSDAGKATVANGVVTGVAAGEVTITATSVSDETIKDTCTITVEADNTGSGDNTGGNGNGGNGNGNGGNTGGNGNGSGGNTGGNGNGNGGNTGGNGNGNGTGGNGSTNNNPTTVTVTGITLNKTSVSLNKGKTVALIATVAPANATNKAVTWTTSNKKVATVSNGTVKAVAKGKATITAKAGDKTATCTVTVKVPAAKVTLNTKQVYVVKGKSVTVKATAAPADTTDKITWSTSNKKTATVKNGKITAKKTGKATITAKAGKKKATLKVTVVSKAKKATKVTLNKKKATLKVKKTLALKAAMKPQASTDTLKWSTSNKKVAKVDKFGTVTAVKKGKATITVKTTSGKKATCKITVK